MVICQLSILINRLHLLAVLLHIYQYLMMFIGWYILKNRVEKMSIEVN